jgi:hypothetical protein
MPVKTASTALEIPATLATVPDLLPVLNDRMRRIQSAFDQGTTAAVASGGSPGELVLSIPGTLGIRSNAAPLVSFPAQVTPTDIVALLKTPPSGAPVTVQLNVGGQPYAVLSIASGQVQAGPQSASTPIPPNTLVTLDVTSVGTAFPGADLSVMLRGV